MDKQDRNAEMTDEARAALQLAPKVREIMDLVRDELPPGTDFGVMVLAPGEETGNVIAMTTDRDVVAPAVARWVLSVLKEKSDD